MHSISDSVNLQSFKRNYYSTTNLDPHALSLMLKLLILECERTAFGKVVSSSTDVGQVVRTSTVEDFLDQFADPDQTFDVASISLLLSRPAPYRSRDRIMVDLEGLSALRDAANRQTKVPLIALAHDPHERTVIHAYQAGARWFVRSDVQPPKDVGSRLLQLVANQEVPPHGLDARALNLWRAMSDPSLGRCSAREIEIIEHVLLDLDRVELLGRLGFANMQTYWTNMTRLLERTGFADAETLAAHAIALGITPAV